MLLCEPSASESGGVVSPPEADVHVLDRECPPPLVMQIVGTEGRENTGAANTGGENTGARRSINEMKRV
jgi:hypothetical protein